VELTYTSPYIFIAQYLILLRTVTTLPFITSFSLSPSLSLNLPYSHARMTGNFLFFPPESNLAGDFDSVLTRGKRGAEEQRL
jgi:hypothetical protein